MLKARLSLAAQSEAMVATLSLSQHKDLDNAARRVAQLEELLQKAHKQNSQLKFQLQTHLASTKGDEYPIRTNHLPAAETIATPNR